VVIADASACSHPQQQSTQPATPRSSQPTSALRLVSLVRVIKTR